MENLKRLLRSNLTKAQAEKVSKRLEGSLSQEFFEDLDTIIEVIGEIRLEEPARQITMRKADPEAIRIAEMLKGYVLELYPYYEKQINVSKWADDIRLMNSSDGIEYRAIEAIIRYLFEMYSPNSNFDWREQIRSGRNLRKHWIRLFELAKKDYEDFNIETV